MTTSPTLVVLFNLKAGVREEDYEIFAQTIDAPTIKRLPSNRDFRILQGTNLFGSDQPAPFRYIEIMEVSGFDELATDLQQEVVQQMLAQFMTYADNPQLIVTRPVA